MPKFKLKTMNSIFKITIMAFLTFVIAFTAVADLSEVKFDSSNCIELSDGSMRKVSIPLPEGWKDAFKNQKMSKEISERTNNIFSLNSILANYYNPKKKTEYVEVIKLGKQKGFIIPYNEYKDAMIEYDKLIKDGSAKADIVKKLPANADKDVDKRFQLFSSHEKNDHSFQFSGVGLTLNNGQIVFFIFSSAIMWMQGHVFKIYAWTIAPNKSKTMEKITETRYFISHWVDAILEANGCDANDMTEASVETGTTDSSDTVDPSDTVDTSDKAGATEEIISKDATDANEEKSAKESIEVTDTRDETVRPKSKIVSFIGKIKGKAKSIIKNDDTSSGQEEEISTDYEDETSIRRYRRKSRFWEIFLPVVLGGLIARLVKRRR